MTHHPQHVHCSQTRSHRALRPVGQPSFALLDCTDAYPSDLLLVEAALSQT